MGPERGAGAAGRSGTARRLVAALIIADTAYAFQQSAIIPAIPTVQDEFGITEAWSAWLLAGPTAGTLSRRVSASRVFAAGLGLAAISMVVLATSGQSVARVVLGAFLIGTGAGLSIQTSSTLAAQGVEAGKTSISTAVNSTVRRLAGGIGGQVSATLLADMATRGGRPGHAAFVVAFLIAAGLALLGGVLALSIPRVGRQGLEE
jgi:MFS family permease